MKKVVFLFTMIFTMICSSSCGESFLEENAVTPPSPTPEIIIGFVPTGSGTCTLYNEDTVPVIFDYPVIEKLLAQPDSAFARGNQCWEIKGETSKTPSYKLGGGSTSFESNYYALYLVDSTYALYEGRRIDPLYPDNYKINVDNVKLLYENYDPFRAESQAYYTLSYEGISDVRAKATQILVAASDYVEKLLRVILMTKHLSFNKEAQKTSDTIVSVTCNNIANLCKLYSDGSHRDSLKFNYKAVNTFGVDIPTFKVDDIKQLYNKSFNFVAETAMVLGNKVDIKWESATVLENILYNGVNYKDSIAPCVAYAKNLVFNADATAVTIYFFEKDIMSGEDYAMLTLPVKVEETVKFKEVMKSFVHNAFRSKAIVSGTNIAVLCDNTATFQKTYTDGSKDKAENVKYVVTNNFTFALPEYIALEAKGKTYSFNGSTATVIGKNVTVSFANRVVSDIMFDNVNYKDSVPQCAAEVKTVRFNESTATFTFAHEQEVITAEVPVTYNRIVKYELIGDPTHDIWHNVTGSGTSFAITCNNHVVVKEIWADGSEGETFELPYVSTNEWSVSGNTTIVVKNLNSVIGVRHEIINGAVALEGNSLNFNHSMKAESVSKGTFTYQPTPCEAVARYITVTSNTTAVVEIYDDNIKIGEYTLPIKVTEIIKIKGTILGGVISDSYPIHVGSKQTWKHIMTSKSGKYYHYYCPENEAIKNTTEPTEYTTIGILTQKQNYAFWYDNSGNKYLGYVEAIQIGQDKEDNLLEYKTMDDQTAYLLGEGEKTLQEKFRYPILATLHKVVIGSNTLWTFDGSEYYQDDSEA